ncbi:MAG: glycosyltransferase family 1 protein [Oscillospiraceae bacterium]|nr:glycosyltransferase family 1 protein [Oscillospiraceae bacterium]
MTKRILCLISCMNAGGAETFLMKLYRQLDREKYQMDFCINVKEKCFYEDEILAMGGRIFRIPSKSENRKEFARQLTAIIQKEKYSSVLRITSNAMGFMDLKIAKKAGATLCAARSSNSSDGKGWKPWLAHRLGRLLYNCYVDVKFAPSDLAAKYTFGEAAYNSGKVSILHNAVDLGVFHYDAEGRTAIRSELGIDDSTVLVGHVGRFDPQKNHSQLISIYAEIAKQQPDSKLLLVGQGKLQQQAMAQAADLGIADRVIFAGIRSDIPKVLSAMDVFVFPSLYEGMPNTVIEAQATGLPCIIADTITREADITGLVQYLPLELEDKLWAEEALNAVSAQRRDTHGDFIKNKYDIQSIADEFVALCFAGEDFAS